MVQGDTKASADEDCRDGEGPAELGGVARFGLRLFVFGLGYGAQGRACNAEFYLLDLLDI